VRRVVYIGWMFLAGFACRSAGGASAPAAAIATTSLAIGAGAAVGAINMSEGHCFTRCAPGSSCNPKTGYCEQGRDDSACGTLGCAKGKFCDSSGLLPECVDDPATAEIAHGRDYQPSWPLFYAPPVQPFP
jgi:hypothetical protein